MATGGIHYFPDFAPHPVPQAACQHPPSSCMVIMRKYTVLARMCMDCGVETTGFVRPSFAVWAFWQKYGWHHVIGRRLCQLSVRIARQVQRGEAE